MIIRKPLTRDNFLILSMNRAKENGFFRGKNLLPIGCKVIRSLNIKEHFMDYEHPRLLVDNGAKPGEIVVFPGGRKRVIKAIDNYTIFYDKIT